MLSTTSVATATSIGRFIDTERADVSAANNNPSIPTGVLTLREAILLAIRHNPDVLNSEIDRINSKYAYNLVENVYHWQYGLAASGGLTHSKVDNIRLENSTHAIITPTARKTLYTGAGIDLQLDEERDSFNFHPRARLSLTQPLLRGFNKEVRFKAHYEALDQEKLSQMQLKGQVASTVLDVIHAYRALILANNNIITAQQSLGEMQDTLKKNAKQIELGTLPATSNIGVEAQLASLKLRLIESRNEVSEAKQTLLQAIGLAPNVEIHVPNDVSIEAEPLPVVNDAIMTAYENNLDFQQTLLSLKQHERDLIKAKDDMRWQVDLSASVALGGGGAFRSRQDRSLNDLVNGENHTEELSLNLHVPIADYPLKAAKVRAETQMEKDQNSLLKVKRALERDINSSITHLRDLAEQVELSKQSVALERKNYELQVKKQELGKGTAMEVTTSQNALIQARIAYITTKVSYLNARAELDNKLGRLVDLWEIHIRY